MKNQTAAVLIRVLTAKRVPRMELAYSLWLRAEFFYGWNPWGELP